MTYSPFDFFQDVATQASVDRAGNWLLLAQADYPWLFDALVRNLNAPPNVVVSAILRQAEQAKEVAVRLMVPAMIQSLDPVLLHATIINLQEFFKEKGY